MWVGGGGQRWPASKHLIRSRRRRARRKTNNRSAENVDRARGESHRLDRVRRGLHSLIDLSPELVLQRPKRRRQVAAQLRQLVRHALLPDCRIFKLLARDPVHQVPHPSPYDVVGDLRAVDVCGFLNSRVRQVVKLDDVPEHPRGLVERTVLVIRGEGVLLEEIFLEELRRLQRDLVGLG